MNDNQKKCPFWRECNGGHNCPHAASKDDKDLFTEKPFCFIDVNEEKY
jgi:hypothetical protein